MTDHVSLFLHRLSRYKPLALDPGQVVSGTTPTSVQRLPLKVDLIAILWKSLSIISI